MNRIVTNHVLLTLAQASKFLNLDEDILQTLAEQKRVPARKIGKTWKFSRSRLDKWLKAGIEPEIALLRMAGTFKDDPDLFKILDDIYKARGRPEREED